MNETLRLFLGIPIPQDVQNKLTSFQKEIQPYIDKASWTPPENMHVTLKFLGNTQLDLLPRIRTHCEAIARRHRIFHVKVSGIGSFQDWRRLRVIWVGFKDGDDITALAKEIDVILGKLGFPRENRPFHPHITLARVKRFRKDKVSSFVENILPTLNSWETTIQVRGFHLYRSILKPKGAEYTILSTFSLTR